jgi:hypothetical protein
MCYVACSANRQGFKPQAVLRNLAHMLYSTSSFLPSSFLPSMYITLHHLVPSHNTLPSHVIKHSRHMPSDKLRPYKWTFLPSFFLPSFFLPSFFLPSMYITFRHLVPSNSISFHLTTHFLHTDMYHVIKHSRHIPSDRLRHYE